MSISPEVQHHVQMRCALQYGDEPAHRVLINDLTYAYNVNKIAHQCWTKDSISLAALTELAQLVLTKRVNTAII